MAFIYRLQKILEFRIRKKEAQLLEVQKAQAEVIKIEQKIAKNKSEIMSTRENMRKADFRLMETYDNYLKSLYDKETALNQELTEALEILRQEQVKLAELEKDVKVLEKHREKALEAYKKEENAAELKRLSEVAIQKFFQKTQNEKEELETELRKKLEQEGINLDEY